jgi:hypothetical protein
MKEFENLNEFENNLFEWTDENKTI